MTRGEEWEGEIHTLLVHSVTPTGWLFPGEDLEYDLEHPKSCSEGDIGYGEDVTDYTCDVAWMEREGRLAESLRYSGTPITAPGTYKIQGWGRKYYVWDAWAYEYDNGVAVVTDDQDQEHQ